MTFIRFTSWLYLRCLFAVLLGMTFLIFCASTVEGMTATVQGHDISDVFVSSIWKTIAYSWLVFPLTGMLAALATGTVLARRGELIGYYCSGGRQRSIVAGWLVCLTPWLFAGFGLTEFGVTYASKQLLELEMGEGQVEKLTSEQRPVEWLSLGAWRLYLPHISSEQHEFKRPELYEMKDGILVAVWNAQSLSYESDTWVLNQANRITTEGNIDEFERRQIELPITAHDLWMVAASPELLDREILKELVEKKRRIGADYLGHELMLHRRLGYPIVLLPLLLLIAPISLQPRRERNIAEAFGVGVVASACVLGLEAFFRVLVMSRTISPALGGWGLPIVVTAILGGVWWFNQRRLVQRVSFPDDVDAAV